MMTAYLVASELVCDAAAADWFDCDRTGDAVVQETIPRTMSAGPSQRSWRQHKARGVSPRYDRTQRSMSPRSGRQRTGNVNPDSINDDSKRLSPACFAGSRIRQHDD